ncbi:SDR family oxidoreductase [Methyloligella sp. 2.7D]|uniref:SDR family NAD(P)-dependent oxidoreductase n=1 Tax=unclassified Methyloligella TaxID=2625955 RepID=UPI00157E0C00|nr:SDR family oxidoreductase [Methyloligella sp. GL2]QKP77646.1 SDR family oxidoreductase [Methyloligella sp. GL2]
MTQQENRQSAAKTAIVTGASRGLGRNTALNLAACGADIILTYHSNKEEAESAVAEIEKLGRKAVAFQLDTADPSSFDGFVAEVGKTLKAWGRERFDYLVNNAGIGMLMPIAETSEADLDRLYAIHVKGPYLLTQKLLPLLSDGGRIVNLSSGLARFCVPGMSAYAMMKGAVEVMTRYMAREFGDRGITVNTVAPGAIETDFGGGAVRDNPDHNAFIASVTAMGRAGVPDDIGPMIADLLTGRNRWLTGQCIEVSGGMFL